MFVSQYCLSQHYRVSSAYASETKWIVSKHFVKLTSNLTRICKPRSDGHVHPLAWPSSITGQNSFSSHSAKCRPIWMTFGMGLLLRRTVEYTCGLNFTPVGARAACTGQTLRTSFYVIAKMYHNSSCIHRINEWLADSAVRRETFRKFLTWAEPEPINNGISGVLRSLHEKNVFHKPIVIC